MPTPMAPPSTPSAVRSMPAAVSANIRPMNSSSARSMLASILRSDRLPTPWRRTRASTAAETHSASTITSTAVTAPSSSLRSERVVPPRVQRIWSSSSSSTGSSPVTQPTRASQAIHDTLRSTTRISCDDGKRRAQHAHRQPDHGQRHQQRHQQPEHRDRQPALQQPPRQQRQHQRQQREQHAVDDGAAEPDRAPVDLAGRATAAPPPRPGPGNRQTPASSASASGVSSERPSASSSSAFSGTAVPTRAWGPGQTPARTRTWATTLRPAPTARSRPPGRRRCGAARGARPRPSAVG
jgi:hypothetical protein